FGGLGGNSGAVNSIVNPTYGDLATLLQGGSGGGGGNSSVGCGSVPCPVGGAGGGGEAVSRSVRGATSGSVATCWPTAAAGGRAAASTAMRAPEAAGVVVAASSCTARR